MDRLMRCDNNERMQEEIISNRKDAINEQI